MSEVKEPLIWKVSVGFLDPDWLDDDGNPQTNMVSWNYHPFESESEARDFLDEAWSRYLEKRVEKGKLSKPQEIHFKIKPIGRFRWWLTWFAHETYQKFDSAAEAIEDFNRFCMEQNFDRYDIMEAHDKQPSDFCWCPMGAEDRWRWEVCDCEKCKTEGISRITH